MSKRSTPVDRWATLKGREVNAVYLWGAAPWRPGDTSYTVTEARYDGPSARLRVVLSGGYSGADIETLEVDHPSLLCIEDDRAYIAQARAVRYNGARSQESAGELAVCFT